jgi:hypothetical protein
VETINASRIRTNARMASMVLPQVNASAPPLAKSIGKTYVAHFEAIRQQRVSASQLILSAAVLTTWIGAKSQAVEVLSLGDLIDGSHGRSIVTQKAAQELEDISRISGCLYESFGDVLPVLRLEWAERLSQFDGPVNLRNLSSLPRWGEIAYLERKQMQAFVDWLFQRVPPSETDANAFMNDLVRVCLLLASHAPVNQIIAGEVDRAAKLQEDTHIPIRVDPGRVRIGMQVMLYSGLEVAAHGVVADLAEGLATTKIVKVLRPNVTLDKGARVQFQDMNFAATARKG